VRIIQEIWVSRIVISEIGYEWAEGFFRDWIKVRDGLKFAFKIHLEKIGLEVNT